MTVDEPSWVGYGANFYYALWEEELNEVQMNYTPGVTTMMFGAASMQLIFPEYRVLKPGYLWKDDTGVADFFLKHGQQPMEILVGSRIFTIIAISVVLILIYFYSRRLLGVLPALLSVLLISLEPYYLGHSRLFTHEGLISSLLVLSILSFIAYLYTGRRKLDLFFSASAGAIACLTKSTSTIIIPFVVLMSVIAYIEVAKQNSTEKENGTRVQLRQLLIWLGIFIVVFILFCPPMWVAPLETLDRIYGAVIRYVFVKGNVSGETAGKSFVNLQGFSTYFQVMLTKTTPIVWVGLWIGIIKKVFNKKSLMDDISKRIIIYVLIFGGLFYCMMSLGSNVLSHHYIMTTIVCLIYTAGLGLAVITQWIKRMPTFRNISLAIFLGMLTLFQSYYLLSNFPYYYTYRNPIIVSINQGILSPPPQGYGEVLDLAAEYLSEKPNAKDIKVMSWYSGIIQYLFPGEVEHIKPIPEWSRGSARKLKESDYLVIYYDAQLKRNLPQKLMHDLSDVSPEHSISLFGIEYIRIYKVSELPDTVFVPDS
ncbi:MAG: glycosyltransferase family 39 protein [Anaerolineales bacterium]